MMKWILSFFLIFLCSSCFGQIKFQGVNATGIRTYFSPKDISGLSNWWAPESSAIIDTVGTNTFSQWNDLIGGKNLNQPTKGRQPTQIALTNTVNGNLFRGLSFDGAQGVMTNNDVSTLLTGNDVPYSMFAVIRPLDAANVGFICFGSSAATGISSNQVTFKPLQGGVNIRYTRTGDDGTVQNSSLGTAVSNGFNFMALNFNGTRVTLDINGVIQETANNSSPASVDTFCLGSLFRAGTFFSAYKGDIVELAFYSGAIGTNNLANLYNLYAKPKYNLP